MRDQKSSNREAEQPAPTRIGSGDLLASPRRIQLSRKAGWKMPPNTAKVSRPTKWGNPYKIGETLYHAGTMFQVNAKKACELYATWIGNQIESGRLDVKELRGKNLACFCPPNQPCHADVLLRLANIRS